jgi:hypothetical protein
MDLLKPMKTLIKGVKDKMQENKSFDEMVKKATVLMDEYIAAEKEKQPWNEKFDREEKIYVGDRQFGNTYSAKSADDARTPIRITQSIIEAQIDLNIPEAVFKPIAGDDEEAVRKLQAEADYTIRNSDLDEVNSSVERVVKKHGMACYKVLWNFNYQGPGFRGRPEIIEVHPKNILWAPGTTDKNKCPCFYHVENETLQDCIRKYGDIAKKLPEYGLCADIKYDTVGDGNGSKVKNTNDVNAQLDLFAEQKNHPLTKYAIVEKWYLDEDDELCLTVFSDKLILLEKPKFYHRRQYDAEKDQFVTDENGKEALLDTFKAEEDYTSEGQDENGNTVQTVKIPKGTEIPYYYPKGPKSIPIVIQNNIPRSKSIVGISDTERTADFEQTMKKMIYKHEEKILKGTTKILYNEQLEQEAAQMLDNDDLTVIPVKDVNNFKAVDFKDDGREALEFYSFISDQLQYMIGITSVWQGINQGESKSGKMTDSLINQTAEKIGIKANEKNIAYKRIYKLLCDFILCFSDGDRPYRIDSKFKPEYGTFNKLDMVKMDDSGNPVWAGWDIEISAEPAMNKNRTALIDQTTNLAVQGFMDPTPRNLLVWKILQKANFPNAESVLQTLQEQVDQQVQMEQEQMQIQQEQQNQEQATQNSPTGQLLNSIASKIGGGNVQG